MNDLIDVCISVKQASQEMGTNKAFILHEIKTGSLEAYKIAKGYKIRRSTLDAYIEARKVQPVSK